MAGGFRGIVRVSIVIPAYNAEATLGECLDACLRQSHPYTEVIVVDDGSSDATPEIAQQHPVRYHRQPNAGPAAARNAGVQLANGDIVAFTDADCVPEPDWIAQLVAGFDHPKTVAVGGTYDIRNGSSLLARLIHEEIVLRHARFGAEVDFLGSFNVAYRRDAFEAVGGFDESFRSASGEDNDLAYRLQDYGGVLRFAPDARVAHYHPTRLGPYLRTQMRHGYWRMKLYAKHPRRGGGDHYAGFGELLGPPAALLLLTSLAVLPLIGSAWFIAVVLAIAMGYLAATRALTRAIARRMGIGSGVAYRSMTVLRDVARGLGLLGGVWNFILLRRGTV